MEKELSEILTNLADAGCDETAMEKAAQIYESGNHAEMIRYLRCCRCGLVEKMHESQRRVDRLDYLIRKVDHKKQ